MKKYMSVILLCLLLLLSACAAAPQAEQSAPMTTAPSDGGESSAPVAPGPSASPADDPPDPSASPAADFIDEDLGKLLISEFMTKNRATLADASGLFPDWIELQNVSGEPLSLEGWAVSDGPDKEPWPLPARTLEPGECFLVFAGGKDAGEGEAPFGLSAEETLCLFTPAGSLADSLPCPELHADEALIIGSEGSLSTGFWATPGYPNSDEGYEAFAASRDAAGPLVINEVMTANPDHPAWGGEEREDWVEIKNVSDSAVELDDYLLWDGSHEDDPFRLPALTLEPGDLVVIVCGGEGPYDAPFSLDAKHDRLYLGTETALCDYLPLHDLPVDGSCGRTEGQNGFFYFTEPTPGEDNGKGFRMVSEAPEALTADGVYDGVDELSVSLSAPGRIYYTINGSRPNTLDAVLDGSLSLTRTTVLRAVAVEDGKAPSRVVTLSYIINENHSLPVLSLAVDDPSLFRRVYMNGMKSVELPACLSLYDGSGRIFTRNCGLQMSGSGSLSLPKKSMAVLFRGCYGDGTLDCDLFDSGVSSYASLQLRAGEAYPTTIIQSDLFQDICLSMSDSLLTQHSKFCVLYINGEYYGIYCMKEKFSRQYYASLKGVSKDSVTMLKYPADGNSDFYRDLIVFCNSADLSDPEQYREFCSLVDVDSLIDWYLIQGVSGNTDIGGNARMFRSTENGGQWSFALYDLDWGFTNSDSIFNNLHTDNYYHSGQARALMEAAMQNEEFRDRILTRYAAVYDSSLSNEAFLAQIDAYEELLAPEIGRERMRWNGEEAGWRLRMEQLRDFIRDYDPEHLAVRRFCEIWKISEETRKAYFGW